MEANYREIQNTVLKRQKIKQFLEGEALNVEYLWKSSCLFTSDFIASSALFCHCVSSIDFLRTSLRKRFELTQIFKTLTTGCDVGFCV